MRADASIRQYSAGVYLPASIALETPTPDQLLNALWRSTVVERATDALEKELSAGGKTADFEGFRDFFLASEKELVYRAVAAEYGISTSAVSNYLSYAKRRFDPQHGGCPNSERKAPKFPRTTELV